MENTWVLDLVLDRVYGNYELGDNCDMDEEWYKLRQTLLMRCANSILLNMIG